MKILAFLFFIFSPFYIFALSLNGVIGENLRARVLFNEVNVNVGDPLVLNLDFFGDADFEMLHPPELSQAVNEKEWKVDNASAKTETYKDARRVTYRVRPLKSGIITFPSLKFSYSNASGKTLFVETSPIPLSVKQSAQAALLSLNDDGENLPSPDGILFAVSTALTDDEQFMWERACRTPNAEAFSKFNFPEAKLNEAACLLMEGNWARARSIYHALEWQIGQTSAIERGLLASLALEQNNANVELPIYRVLLRPILRFSWIGRLSAIFLAIALVIILFLLLSRLLKIFVCLALFIAPLSHAEDSFSLFEQLHKQMQKMTSSRLTINGIEQKEIKINAKIEIDRDEIVVGEEFAFILTIESEKDTTIEPTQFSALREVPQLSINYNAIERLSTPQNKDLNVNALRIPARVNAPFSGSLAFRLAGSARQVKTESSNGRHSSFSFSQTFSQNTPPVNLKVKALESEPPNFSGVVGRNFLFSQSANKLRVETNTVVTVTRVLKCDGFIPNEKFNNIIEAKNDSVIWLDYIVASGQPTINKNSLIVYDTDKKSFVSITDNALDLTYFKTQDEDASLITLDAKETEILPLYFAPNLNSKIIARASKDVVKNAKRGETLGDWTRVELPNSAGWCLIKNL